MQKLLTIAQNGQIRLRKYRKRENHGLRHRTINWSERKSCSRKFRLGITSFEEAQLFELRRTNQELAKINDRAMKKRKKELVFKAIGILILVVYIILQILQLLNED